MKIIFFHNNKKQCKEKWGKETSQTLPFATIFNDIVMPSKGIATFKGVVARKKS
jgi:hypothetical protein